MAQVETKTVELKWGERSTSNVMTLLIPFNCIVDTMVGLVNLINKEYNHPNVFKSDLIAELCLNIKELVSWLYKREYLNPIYSLMNSPEEQVANDYYEEFIDERYPDILELSVFTEIFNLIQVFRANNDDIKITIAYSEECEKNFLSGFEEFNDIPLVSYFELDDKLDHYNQFYFNSVYDPLLYHVAPRINHKSIYILDYKYNYDENGELEMTLGIQGLMVQLCKVSTISAYIQNKLVIDEEKLDA